MGVLVSHAPAVRFGPFPETPAPLNIRSRQEYTIRVPSTICININIHIYIYIYAYIRIYMQLGRQCISDSEQLTH